MIKKRLGIEGLETRKLMAVDLGFAGSEVIVDDDGTATVAVNPHAQGDDDGIVDVDDILIWDLDGGNVAEDQGSSENRSGGGGG